MCTYIYSGKPPFRFLHDVFSVIIRDTGTLSGNHFQSEWNGMEVVVVVVVVVGFNYVDNVFLELVGHRRPEYWLNDDIGIL